MATPVKVYGPTLSTAVSRVLACLLEKDVDFQLISVDMSKGEHKKPEYLKIQVFPFLKSPFSLFSFFYLTIGFDFNSLLVKCLLFKMRISLSSVNI